MNLSFGEMNSPSSLLSGTARELLFLGSQPCTNPCGWGLLGGWRYPLHRGKGAECEYLCTNWFVTFYLSDGYECGSCNYLESCPQTCTNKAFTSRAELLDAVDNYMSYKKPEESEAAAEYGTPIGSWCVGAIQDFSEVFSTHRNLDARYFEDDIRCWDMSSATDLSSMFRGATSFNEALSDWNVERVTSMSAMFAGARSFNQDLYWQTDSLQDISNMFHTAHAFNGDITGWSVDRVTFPWHKPGPVHCRLIKILVIGRPPHYKTYLVHFPTRNLSISVSPTGMLNP